VYKHLNQQWFLKGWRSFGCAFLLFAGSIANASWEGGAFAEEAAEAEGSSPLSEFDGHVQSSKAAMMRAPGDALEAAKQGFEAAERLPEDKRAEALSTALWLQAEASLRLGQPEEGLAIASQALDIIDGRDDLKELRGSLILAKGRLAGRVSDVSLAVTSFIEAHELFEQAGNARRQAIALQSLGSIHNDAQSYDTALEYFRRSAEVFTGDDILLMTNKNNVANIMRETGKFDQARMNFTEALALAKKMDSPVLVGRILSNIAELEQAAGNVDDAQTYLDEALSTLATDGGEQWARHARSTEAGLALTRGDVERARYAVEQGFRGLDIEATNMSFRQLHKAASEVYSATGEWPLALAHLEQFKRLEDEARSLAASSNLALISGRFQYTEQQNRLERLRIDQMRNEAELSAGRERQRAQQTIIIGGGIISLVVASLCAMVFFQKRHVSQVNGKLTDIVDQLSEEISLRKEVEAALIEAKEKAETADQMKSTFLATMSHELRTPMNGILGFTEVLLSGDLNDDQREQIEIIDQSSGSLLTLINDILDLSQLEAGKFKLRKGAFDLRVTVENAIKLLRAKAQEKHLGLVVYIEPDVPSRAFGDEDRLRQILLNLVGNAVKFTELGAVTLIVGKGPNAGDIQFKIHDSGIGIPADKVNALFDRFSQIDGTATRKHAGSGLGLAICKELVSAMGGDIGCSSVMGEGSIFHFCIPLADRRSMATIEPHHDLKASIEGKRIVLIDDVDLRAEALTNMLTANQSVVERFADPDEAIKALSASNSDDTPVDAVLVSDCHNDDMAVDVRKRLESQAGLTEDRLIGFGFMDQQAADGFATIIENPMTVTGVKAAIDRLTSTAAAKKPERKPASSAMRSGQVDVVADGATTDKILIVDDVPANRKLVEVILGQMGVISVTAENGQQATEMARVEKFGLILMDVYMPVMGGIEAARTIRGDGLNIETPIFALTASASAEERGDAVDAGMQGVLTKPLNMKALRSTVSDALSGKVVVEASSAQAG